jgi:hypothetical protein
MNELGKAWGRFLASVNMLPFEIQSDHAFDAGFDAGHNAAVDKYAPALSAAEAERDLARGNELAIHDLARAIGQILNGPGDADG